MVLGVIEPQVEVPPVVKKRDEVGHEPARGQFARGVAAPAPLVFEFIVTVFPVTPVAILFGENDGGPGFFVQGGDQHGDLAAPRSGLGIPPFPGSVREIALTVFAPPFLFLLHGLARLPGRHHGIGIKLNDGATDRSQARRFTHQDDAPLPAPAAELQGTLQGLPAIPATDRKEIDGDVGAARRAKAQPSQSSQRAP